MNVPMPTPDEYRDYQGDYIRHIPADADLLSALDAQLPRLRAMLQPLTEAQASTPHKPDEWTVKQVLGHLSDTERVLSYRALCLARGDKSPFPGFEQDDYAKTARSNERTLASLLDEFGAVRAATICLYQSLTPETYTLVGTVSGSPASVRAVLRIIPGHVEHHLASLKADYKL